MKDDSVPFVLFAQTSFPCVDTVVLDVERLGGHTSGSQRAPLRDQNQPSISLEPLSPPHSETTPRTPADITVAITSKITGETAKWQTLTLH